MKYRTRWIRSDWGKWIAFCEGLNPEKGKRTILNKFGKCIGYEDGWIIRTNLTMRQLKNIGLITSKAIVTVSDN